MKDYLPPWIALLALAEVVTSIYLAGARAEIRKLTAENQHLKRRLGLWLRDCLSLYKLEEMMAFELLHVNVWARSSVIAIKRFFRDKLRKHGNPSPSERCTPKKIEEELAAL